MSRYMNLIGVKARKASDNKVDTKTKNKVLRDYVSLITKEKKLILSENKKDIEFATKMRLKENLINRLLINEEKIEDIKLSVQKIEKLRDPVLVSSTSKNKSSLSLTPLISLILICTSEK